MVTGASCGLGDRFARVLHAAGATVVVAARRKDRLDALGERAAGQPSRSRATCRGRSTASGWSAEVLEQLGTIDVLVNNAGIGHTVSIEDETVDVFRNAVEVNLTAIWHLSKLAGEVDGGPAPRQHREHRVDARSGRGRLRSKQAHYTASKGAVINLTRELAVQWARKGVRVNALAPGWFPSEMTAGMETDEGAIQFVKTQLPDGPDGRGPRARRCVAAARERRRQLHHRRDAPRRRRLDRPLVSLQGGDEHRAGAILSRRRCPTSLRRESR